MSAENVEVARAAYEAFRSGDLEGVGKQFADNVEWEAPDTLPNGGIFRGRDAVLGSFAEIPKYWSKFSVDPDEYIDAGDHVVVRGVQSLTGPGGSTQSRLPAPLHAEQRQGRSRWVHWRHREGQGSARQLNLPGTWTSISTGVGTRRRQPCCSRSSCEASLW